MKHFPIFALLLFQSIGLDAAMAASPTTGASVSGKKSPSEPWTDTRTLAIRESEEVRTRPDRVRNALVAGAATDFSGRDRQDYAKLFLGQDVAAANADLRKYYQDELDDITTAKAELWDLQVNTRLILAYYQLGSRGTAYKGRLEQATEKLLLRLLWERTVAKNDIALTNWNVWWMTGSENHDLNTRVSSLVSSRIFMDEPDYASRVYPDEGHGAGHAYWFSHADTGSYGPDGAAELKDGKSYVAKDHYTAWVRLMKHYVAERARRGFFVERASSLYTKWTMMFLYTLHDYCGDEDLKTETGEFLNLVWADWAQEEINGLRGGSKSRQKTAGGYDSMTDLARFHMGGAGRSGHIYDVQLFTDYRWPAYVWELATDKAAMGSFAAISRGIGEEQTVRPRPAGAERTMLGDVESRMVNYSWVTPDYILGTKIDHPDAVYGHLTIAERWQGLIVGSNPNASVTLCAGDHAPAGTKKPTIDLMQVCQSVQDRQVLITQQKRRWAQINPDWFPAIDLYARPLEVRFGKAWSKVEEKGGWVFLQEGQTYAAVRVLAATMTATLNAESRDAANVTAPGRPDTVVPSEDAYVWNADRTSIVLKDKFSPVIIEAGGQPDFATLDDFKAAILANPLTLLQTVVPGYFIAEYRGCGADAKTIRFNASTPDIPSVAGQPFDFASKTFDSPFIQSSYKSGVVTIRTPSGATTTLDFNRFDAPQ